MRNLRCGLPLLLVPLLGFWIIPVQADNSGFLYGKITTREGKTYTGALRWGTQECFWDDLFNADKDDNPWEKYARGDVHKKHTIRIFGITTTEIFNSSLTHLFIARFGDLKTIEVKRKNRTTVLLKNGTEYEVSGYGDVGETIQILDESLGKIKIEWDRIRTIDFLPTPATAKTPGYRLKGKVVTDEMEFSGFVMWDAEECLSTDLLEGESDDGELAIEFGNIRSLKRLGGNATQVTLKDGRELEMRGTNDVNSDNRGIYVQDDRYGKIEIGWDQFREVTYEKEDGSGQPYEAYSPTHELKGIVTGWGDKEYRGKIVFDFDEVETGDILNGKLDEMQFYLPFGQIASITPRGRHSSLVTLRSGEELRFEDTQDVTENNSGILIFTGAKEPEYVAWEDVETVVFDK